MERVVKHTGVLEAFSLIYARFDKWPKSSAFHAGVTGSNPVPSTIAGGWNGLPFLAHNQAIPGSTPGLQQPY